MPYLTNVINQRMKMAEQPKLTLTKTLSPFREASPGLYKKGYSLVPLKYRTKRPTVNNWSEFSKERADKQQMKTWYNVPESNIGLVLGRASGVIALDFDHDVDGLHEKIQALMGPVVVAKTAEKGFTAFFRYNGEKSHNWQKDGEMVLELLSDGRQTVMPPSMHPCGKAYIYTTEKTLEEVTASELPYLPEDFTEEVEALLGRRGSTRAAPRGEAELGEVSQALDYIEPGDYYTWVKIGMALKEEFGDEAFNTWDEWSQGDDKYQAEGMMSKWQSFKNSGVTAGTIFHLAVKNGYRFTRTDEPAAQAVDNDSILDVLNSWREKGKPIGVKCGIDGLDSLLKWRRGELTIVSGYPGSGKSEVIDYVVHKHLMSNNYKTMFASFEGSGVAAHVDSFLHRVDGRDFEERSAADDRAAFEKIKDKLVFYDDENSSHDIDSILEYAKGVKDLDILVIDPFNYVTSRHVEQTYLHVKYCLKRVKQFCKATGCMAILVAHPKTKREKSKEGVLMRCNIWDCAGGHDFWNMADNALLVHRDREVETEIDVSVQKVKIQDTDRTGTFALGFNRKTRLYDDIESYNQEF
jgi:KaiC/GvpD/RAD55 family RecA-like ATPase